MLYQRNEIKPWLPKRNGIKHFSENVLLGQIEIRELVFKVMIQIYMRNFKNISVPRLL